MRFKSGSRPSGIKRYTHGVDGKGAMVMDMHEKARYPGDPQGQAAVAGVKKGFVVKAVNGTDVRSHGLSKRQATHSLRLGL